MSAISCQKGLKLSLKKAWKMPRVDGGESRKWEGEDHGSRLFKKKKRNQKVRKLKTKLEEMAFLSH